MEREEEFKFTRLVSFIFSKSVYLEVRLTNQATLSSLLHYVFNDSRVNSSGKSWVCQINSKEWRGALRQEATFLVTVLVCGINTFQYKVAGWHSTVHGPIVAVVHMRLNLQTWSFKYFLPANISSSCQRGEGPRTIICYQLIRATTEPNL